MILGIDFSLKSTAAVLNTGTDYQFYTFARTSVVKEDVSIALSASGVNVNLIPDEPPLAKKSTIAQREQSSLTDAKVLIPAITECFENTNIDDFGIEGFSFASTGNRLAQISGYQWVLRWELASITAGKMWIFSPMTVKATAGKGNYKKEEMIAAFLNSEDPLLQGNPFWQSMKNQPSLFQNKKGTWMKPIDDLIDAYWVLKTTEAHRKL